MAREGRSVIAPDGLGQSMSVEQIFKTLPDTLSSRIFHSAHFQDVTAEFITNRQRLLARPICPVPPPLKIDRPHLIGSLSTATAAQTSSLLTVPTSTRLHQARALQHTLEAAFTGHLRMLVGVKAPDFSRSPPPLPFQAHDLTHYAFA